jgi:hypothetical protein
MKSLNLAFLMEFDFCELIVFVRVTLRLEGSETLRGRVHSIRCELTRRPDESDLLDHTEGSVTSGSQKQVSL